MTSSFQVFSDNRCAVLPKGKTQLVQLGFERDLTRKYTTKWKDTKDQPMATLTDLLKVSPAFNVQYFARRGMLV